MTKIMESFFSFYCKYPYRSICLKYITLVYQIEVKTLVEVGVWEGVNAMLLRRLFPEASFYLIDSWEPTLNYLKHGHPVCKDPEKYEEAFQKTQKQFKNDPKVTILRKTSKEGSLVLPDELDLVFLDACHQYSSVKEDITLWEKKVRAGGILSGHDYHHRYPGVVRAVNECLKGRFFLGADKVWGSVITHNQMTDLLANQEAPF